jgi:peptide/nickel transport system permease protein
MNSRTSQLEADQTIDLRLDNPDDGSGSATQDSAAREPSQPAARRRKMTLTTRVSAVLTFALFAVAILAPIVAPYEPDIGDRSQRLLPLFSGSHVLGTDGQGRDILSRIIWGARPSLLAGVVPVLVAALVGTALGLVAGRGSRRVHSVIMRVLDVFYAFPAVLLAIAIAAALGSGISNAIVALSFILIPPVARVAEAEVSRVRSTDFMEAAAVSGAGWWSISIRHVLPNVAPAIVVYCTALVGLSIVYAAGLGFLGLGIAPPTAEWGLMVNDLRQYTFSQPGIAVVPAVVITIASLLFNLLGDGLRDWLDIRSEAQ